jgi:hypothetical protein
LLAEKEEKKRTEREWAEDSGKPHTRGRIWSLMTEWTYKKRSRGRLQGGPARYNTATRKILSPPPASPCHRVRRRRATMAASPIDSAWEVRVHRSDLLPPPRACLDLDGSFFRLPRPHPDCFFALPSSGSTNECSP